MIAVTVSVDYADFLVHTLEENAKLFDKWYIVTNLTDSATVELCNKYPNVVCLQTDIFYKNGAVFNKWAGINHALKQISKDEWVLFLDSDIALHELTRRTLESIHLDTDCIYGMDRLNIQGKEKWDSYKVGKGQLTNNWLLTTQGLDFGARLVHHYGHEGENGRFEGYRPLGYFQLCHRSCFEFYPEMSTGADACDLMFARQWPRKRRVLIPELFCLHLESYGAGKSINWFGRKSAPFDMKISGREQELMPVKEGETTEEKQARLQTNAKNYYTNKL